MRIEIDRDHMNGDYCVTMSRDAARPGVDRVTSFWLSEDEFADLARRLVEETADPGIEPTAVS